MYALAFDHSAFKWPPVKLYIYGAMMLLFERDAGYNLLKSLLFHLRTYLSISLACLWCLSRMADSPLADLQSSTIDVTRRLAAQNIALRLPGSSARHDSVRRHVCSNCGRAFNRAAHLRVHTAIHSRLASEAVRHICSICSRSYLSIDSLRRHTRRKHLELTQPRTSIRHICSICDRSYPTMQSLRRHTRRQHAMSLARSALMGGSPLQEPAFLRLYGRFIDTYNAEFPSTPCSSCGILMFPKKAFWVDYDQAVEYGLFSILGLPLTRRIGRTESAQISVCYRCKTKPRPPILAGPWPTILIEMPQSCRPYLSPLRLSSNLGKVHGTVDNPNSYLTYRSMTGQHVPTFIPC